jgi:hypothetical protein
MKLVIYTSGYIRNSQLTLGKEYRIITEYPKGIIINNDQNVPCYYSKEHFDQKDELRKQIIKNILKI